MAKKIIRMSFGVGEGVAVVRREGSSVPIVANILGVEVKDGIETVYLDRLVHNGFQDWQDWIAAGAVSTILSRESPIGASSLMSQGTHTQ